MKKITYWTYINVVLLGIYLNFVFNLGFNESLTNITGVVFFSSLTANMINLYRGRKNNNE